MYVSVFQFCSSIVEYKISCCKMRTYDYLSIQWWLLSMRHRVIISVYFMIDLWDLEKRWVKGQEYWLILAMSEALLKVSVFHAPRTYLISVGVLFLNNNFSSDLHGDSDNCLLMVVSISYSNSQSKLKKVEWLTETWLTETTTTNTKQLSLLWYIGHS